MRPTILALDLEGTLISNAVSQIPRPGLASFLEQVQSRFDSMVMFTTVDESSFRSISRLLVSEGHAPGWFSSLECISWSGPTKDLTIVAPDLGRALLLDDYKGYVHPGQERWWIEAPHFCRPYPETDQGLMTAAYRIEQRLTR
jgi:hypothetical protein